MLTDHAYCEQKAAISCISFIQHLLFQKRNRSSFIALSYRRMGAF
nr:hypothetical protein [Hydrotalea sp.]